MQNKSLFAFTRINFILLGIALLIIVVGFVLMSGPGSTDTHFEPSIFDQRRTVVAPMVCFVGYLFCVSSPFSTARNTMTRPTGSQAKKTSRMN